MGGKHGGQSGGKDVLWKRSRSDEDKPTLFTGWRPQLKPQKATVLLTFLSYQVKAALTWVPGVFVKTFAYPVRWRT